MAMSDNDEFYQKLDEISEKLSSDYYPGSVSNKLDKIGDKLSSGRYGDSVSDKLDKMIELLESIERKLG